MPELNAARIAIIGDLHGSWTPFDSIYFGRSHYDLLLFVGDLAGGSAAHDRQIAKSIARVNKPALVLLGNNDVQALSTIESELSLQQGLHTLLSGGKNATMLCGYSSHALRAGSQSLTLIAARPFAMGGAKLSFPDEVSARHGVRNMGDSAARLCALVDEADSDALIFLAHNGPHGLGAQPTDLWGNDFSGEGGDWGDPDLSEAIRHAKAAGKRVHAVIAGHMHRQVRGGGERPLMQRVGGVQYINPAQVPRVVPSGQGALHHHVELVFRDGVAYFHEHWVSDGDV